MDSIRSIKCNNNFQASLLQTGKPSNNLKVINLNLNLGGKSAFEIDRHLGALQWLAQLDFWSHSLGWLIANNEESGLGW